MNSRTQESDCDVRQEFCDLCGPGSPGRALYRQADFDVLTCPRCGLYWTVPFFLTGTALPEDAPYWAGDIYQQEQDSQKARFREQLALCQQLAQRHALKVESVLEVGSGLGFFLDVAGEYGLRAQGCDISREAVAYANREAERSRVGTLDAHYAGDSLDAIFAFNLIEHLPNPRDFLEQAFRIIKPGGLLVLETPVRESLFQFVSHSAYRATGGRLAVLSVSPGGHIFLFSRKTLDCLANDMGFRVLYAKNISSPFQELFQKRKLLTSEWSSAKSALYSFVMPLLWGLGAMTGYGNRIFTVLQKGAATSVADRAPQRKPAGRWAPGGQLHGHA